MRNNAGDASHLRQVAAELASTAQTDGRTFSDGLPHNRAVIAMATASTSGRPAVTAEQLGGDKVVREINVCLCNGVLGSDTKVGRLLVDEVVYTWRIL